MQIRMGYWLHAHSLAFQGMNWSHSWGRNEQGYLFGRCAIKYFLDEEFLDTGSAIELVSIGIVCEDGRELYAQSVEFNPRNASAWVWENVFPHVQMCPYTETSVPTVHHPASNFIETSLKQHRQGQCVDQIARIRHRCPWRTREQLRRDVQSFLDVVTYGKPEIWGYYSAYDFVALCQIFGTMMDLPSGYPHYIHELQQILDEHGLTDDMLPQQEIGLHHSLADARWIKHLWEWVTAWQVEQFTPEQLDHAQAIWNELVVPNDRSHMVITTVAAMAQLKKMGLLKEE